MGDLRSYVSSGAGKKKNVDCFCWTSLAFQWFRLHASAAAGGMGWIPGQGTRVPPAVWLGPKNEMFFFMASSPSLEKLQARRGWRGPPSHPLLLPRVSSAHSHGVDGPKKAWSPRMKLTGRPSALPLPTLHYFDPDPCGCGPPPSTVTGSSGPHPPTAGDSQDKGSPRSFKKLSFMQRGTWSPWGVGRSRLGGSKDQRRTGHWPGCQMIWARVPGRASICRL